MRLATRADGTRDGELVVVSADGARAVPAKADWPNLLAAIEAWDEAAPALLSLDPDQGELRRTRAAGPK